MGFGKNITLSKSYSSETQSLWAKITFSNGQYTHFFFRTTGRNPHTWHRITDDHQPGLFFPFRKKLQPHFSTNPPLTGSSTSNQGEPMSLQATHLYTQKKSLHSHFLCTDTSKPGSVLPKPSTVPTAALQNWRETGRKLSGGGRKREEHVSYKTPPTDWQLSSFSPGLLCSLDQDLSSQKDRELWRKNKQTANSKQMQL